MPYRQTIQELEAATLTNAREGLSEKEAAARLQRFGGNELEKKKEESLLKKVAEQFNDPMILILILGAVISIFLHEVMDSVIIVAVITINALIGVFQEWKAEKALHALEKMTAMKAVVKRDGQLKQIDAADLVLGDLVFLEAGNFVPADLRLIETVHLKVEESSLTGESVPVDKDASARYPKDQTLPLADQKNMAFSSTIVLDGNAAGLVVATGMDSEIGKIAKLLQHEEKLLTPLQRRLAELSKVLGALSVIICAAIFVIAVIQKRDLFEMLLTSISLAVAAIPEGLPAVVTISLALGVQKMSDHHAIARKLHAVETLGQVSVICTDKTGTLTQNRMTVVAYYLNGKIQSASQKVPERRLKEGFYLCGNAKLDAEGVIGDPTEVALMRWALDNGVDAAQIIRQFPRVAEIPFDSRRKRMSTVHQTGLEKIVYVKGALESVLPLCTHLWQDGRRVELTTPMRRQIEEAAAQMAGEALRVLVLATRTVASLDESQFETRLCFIGMAGMIDPPKEGVKEAIALAHKAGIDVVMITGDHPETALAIGRQLGIAQSLAQVLTSVQMQDLSDDQLAQACQHIRIVARATPQDKVRIVKAYRLDEKIVAMTGDGVNDAPSLKQADVGIAMGSGTEVSRQTSDLILTDDNFATIISAVEEGRNIYLNIQKAVLYLLSCNLGEITTLFLAIVLMPVAPAPLSAIQILWINLVTDAFPALSLAAEPQDPYIMDQKPRAATESLFANGGWAFMVFNGLYIGTISLVAFKFGSAYDVRTAHTMTFMVLSIAQLFHSLNLRSLDHSIFRVGIFRNKLLLATFVIGVALQVMVVNLPIFQLILKTAALDWVCWGIVFGLSASLILINEISKLFNPVNHNWRSDSRNS